jgi:hypothetical protein
LRADSDDLPGSLFAHQRRDNLQEAQGRDDVELDEVGELVELVGKGLQRRCTSGCEDQVRAECVQMGGDGAADTGARPGDDDDAV